MEANVYISSPWELGLINYLWKMYFFERIIFIFNYVIKIKIKDSFDTEKWTILEEQLSYLYRSEYVNRSNIWNYTLLAL